MTLLHEIGGWQEVMVNEKFDIKRTYALLMDEQDQVPWRKTKRIFIRWMGVQNR